MDIKLDKNGWTVHINDLDPRILTDENIKYLRTLPFTNILVIIHDVPTLTQHEYREFAHKIFHVVQNDNPAPDKRFLDNTDREIMRVTGRKNEHGEIIGLFGMPGLLDWHCNQPGMPLDLRPDCLTLYSVEGAYGSITAYTNSILALKDLRNDPDAPIELIKNLDNIDVYYEYVVDTDQLQSNIDYVGYSGKNKLVTKNKSGQEGILFGNLQSNGFYLGTEKLDDQIYMEWSSYLKTFLTQKKYVYNHAWKNNQITMNCQILSQHARYPFKNIEKRLLWRVMGKIKNFDECL